MYSLNKNYSTRERTGSVEREFRTHFTTRIIMLCLFLALGASLLPQQMPLQWRSRRSSSRAAVSMGSRSDTLRAAWDAGDSACALRPRVEALAANDPFCTRVAATAAASRRDRWAGLWVGRIEHFERVPSWMGLRVRAHFEIAADGGITSHLYCSLKCLKLCGWASASGELIPASSSREAPRMQSSDAWDAAWEAAAALATALKTIAGTAAPGVAEPAERLGAVPRRAARDARDALRRLEVQLRLDDVWLSADGRRPRTRAGPQGSELQGQSRSVLDECTRALGRLLFVDALAGFPIVYADLDDGRSHLRYTGSRIERRTAHLMSSTSSTAASCERPLYPLTSPGTASALVRQASSPSASSRLTRASWRSGARSLSCRHAAEDVTAPKSPRAPFAAAAASMRYCHRRRRLTLTRRAVAARRVPAAGRSSAECASKATRGTCRRCGIRRLGDQTDSTVGPSVRACTLSAQARSCCPLVTWYGGRKGCGPRWARYGPDVTLSPGPGAPRPKGAAPGWVSQRALVAMLAARALCMT